MRGTSHIDLVYDRSSDIFGEIVSYVDSDYARDFDKRRSLIKYVFTFCGNVISEKVTLQSIIVLSIIEVEYMTTIKVIKEVI